MQIPVGKGAKGSHKSKQGVVKYIVIGSVKLKSHVGTDRSIAHFYRHVDVYPYFNPSIILAPSLKALTVDASKALFMGGSGKVNLSATLHRLTWVAGQRCYVDVRVKNGASKKVRHRLDCLLPSVCIADCKVSRSKRSTSASSEQRPSSDLGRT